MKQYINVGHTNKSKYIEDGRFYIEKEDHSFNHRLDYFQLQIFDFVPKLYEDSPSRQVWAAIDGKMVQSFDNEQLTALAKILRTLHKSDLKLPNNNFRERINFYLKTMSQKNKTNAALNAGYKKAQSVLVNMRRVNPCHNDFWYQNLLYTSAHKFFVVDWEYATMGDKHFDLAFFIESANLTPEQEAVFLAAYNAVDGDISYTPNYLMRHKFFVNYFTLCWALAQSELPFPVDGIEKRILTLLKDPTIFNNKF